MSISNRAAKEGNCCQQSVQYIASPKFVICPRSKNALLRDPDYLCAAIMASIRDSVSKLQSAFTSSSRGSRTVCSSMSLREGPAWDSRRASSLNVCRLWWSRVLSPRTKDSVRYSESTVNSSVLVEVRTCSSSCSSVLLDPPDEGRCRRSRTWARVWLAAEATNRLVSVCSCRSGSMKPGVSRKQISPRKQ